jgi:hypothetical protein
MDEQDGQDVLDSEPNGAYLRAIHLQTHPWPLLGGDQDKSVCPNEFPSLEGLGVGSFAEGRKFLSKCHSIQSLYLYTYPVYPVHPC